MNAGSTLAAATLLTVLALLLPAGPARAVFMNGNELYHDCSEENSDKPQGQQMYMLCLGYISGIADGIETAEIGNRHLVCAPGEATVGQLVDIVKKYLHDHPETRHRAAGVLVFLALVQAFPCPK
jgi:Rap1a immunity proteins